MNVDSPDQPASPRKPLNLDTALDVNSSSESWQHALFDAVVETRRSKALPLICRARSIVDCRLAEIVFEEPSYPSEVLDLRSSQIYLGLLLECVGNERGELLWD
jgi:hypothetical protein